jgi:phage gpG-like protein
MFRFKVDIAGEVQMDRGIARFAEGVADYRPIWPVIEDDFYADVKDQFATEGAAGGEVWQPLSPAYAEWKEAHYPGMPIMQRTGNLMRSLTTGTDANSVKIEQRKALTLGSRLPYGIYHQSLAPRTVLPRRPVIQLTDQFRRATMRNVQAYLVQVATQAGFRTGLGPLQTSKFSSFFGMGAAPQNVWRAGAKRRVA